jgi:hypothetical protein
MNVPLTAFVVMDGNNIIAVCETMATARKVWAEAVADLDSIPRRFKVIKALYIKDES